MATVSTKSGKTVSVGPIIWGVLKYVIYDSSMNASLIKTIEKGGKAGLVNSMNPLPSWK